MIIFNTDNYKFYNYIIHHFMKMEELDLDVNIKPFLKKYIFSYLYREQFSKSCQCVKDIYNWTINEVPHFLDTFHEVVLYGIIQSMNDLQEKNPDFNNLYFDENARKIIHKIARKDQKELPNFTFQELKEEYYNTFNYYDVLFADLDFLYLEKFYNSQNLGNNTLIKNLGINLEYYFDILPKDIQKNYQTGHITFNGEIIELIHFLEDEIENRDLAKLFW